MLRGMLRLSFRMLRLTRRERERARTRASHVAICAVQDRIDFVCADLKPNPQTPKALNKGANSCVCVQDRIEFVCGDFMSLARNNSFRHKVFSALLTALLAALLVAERVGARVLAIYIYTYTYDTHTHIQTLVY
jgi:hypothetical protein